MNYSWKDFFGSGLEAECITSATSLMSGKCSLVYAQEKKGIIWWTPNLFCHMRLHFWTLYFVSLISFSITIPIPWHIYLLSYKTSTGVLNQYKASTSNLVLLFYNCLTQIFLTFLLHINSRIYLSSSRKSGQNSQLDTIKSSFWTATYLKEKQAQTSLRSANLCSNYTLGGMLDERNTKNVELHEKANTK